MQQTIGFIGVGHLVEFMIRGLRRGGFNGEILVTPRSLKTAEMLVEQCDCTIKTSAEILQQCAYIGLAVRPSQVEETLKALTFEAHHVIISYVAGMSLTQMQNYTDGTMQLVRAMPISAASVCASPTMIFPAHAEVEKLLNHCGKTVVLKQESDFTAGSVVACVYASILEY